MSVKTFFILFVCEAGVYGEAVELDFKDVPNKAATEFVCPCCTLLRLQCQRRPGRRRWCSAAHTHGPVDKGQELTPYIILNRTLCVCMCMYVSVCVCVLSYLKFHDIYKSKVVESQVLQNL